MNRPSLGASASVFATAIAGGFVTYIAATCNVSITQLLAGGGMAMVAAVIHLYQNKPSKPGEPS